MKRRIVFIAEAREEFERAAAWYEQQQPGLGLRFAAEVDETLKRISSSPERFRLVSRSVRVARVAVFESYSVYFHLESEFIGIVSVFHASRDPAELKRRLS